MITYYISIGSNMGNRQAYLDGAVKGLQDNPALSQVLTSSWIETEPWGLKHQASFLNGLIRCQSTLHPQAMLSYIQSLEQAAKRERKIHWGPRTLDLDIIWAQEGDQVMQVDQENLQIPHPYFWNRSFVLEPLAQLEPQFSYEGQSIQERLQELQV